jgi:hypothetical protein
MECKECGAANDENAAFCKMCGSPLTPVEAAETPGAAGAETAHPRGRGRTYVEGAYFVISILSSIAGMFSYFFPWVEVSASGALTRYHEYLWYWPLIFADTAFLTTLVFFGFNLLPILLAFTFAVITSVQIKSGEIGKGFFHAALFMAVIFAFFVAGCIDFAEYVTTPFQEQWLLALGPSHGAVAVTVRVGAAFLLLLPAALGYLVSTALCGFSLWRRKELTVRAAGVSFVLSFVACLGGYILIWSLFSLTL